MKANVRPAGSFLHRSFRRGFDPVTIEPLLHEMVDRDSLARFPKTNFRLKYHTTYNRASVSPVAYVTALCRQLLSDTVRKKLQGNDVGIAMLFRLHLSCMR